MGKGVNILNDISTFVLSVIAGVVSNYICKWLDEIFRADD